MADFLEKKIKRAFRPARAIPRAIAAQERHAQKAANDVGDYMHASHRHPQRNLGVHLKPRKI